MPILASGQQHEKRKLGFTFRYNDDEYHPY
jgi:hypothetical protein